MLLCVLALAGCGGDDGETLPPDAPSPTDVPFGTTAIVVVVNPSVNDANTKTGLATPGTIREGVTLTTDDNVTATTGPDGIARCRHHGIAGDPGEQGGPQLLEDERRGDVVG